MLVSKQFGGAVKIFSTGERCNLSLNKVICKNTFCDVLLVLNVKLKIVLFFAAYIYKAPALCVVYKCLVM